MKMAGLVKASLIDYPGNASAVIFFGGCNFRCGYCHNPEIVNCGEPQISEEAFLEFLRKRKRFLDAICISGGEPTLQKELYSLCVKIKEMGYRIKLDTNGTQPLLLKQLAKERLLDYVAMDVKAPLNRYCEVVSATVDKAAICESIDFLLEGSIPYEFRTTVCRELLAFKDLEEMSKELQGAKQWYLQTFKKQGMLLDSSACFTAYSSEEMLAFADKLNQRMQQFLYDKNRAVREDFTCVSVR